ncbi:hypothetical protein QTH87_21270 [Variovorax sp. J22P168]|uniref:hypothetical protein n=1 Tax=Variovorax jilinensis TaxID=3053513 RepID=UPI0025788D62|nr:hypothetical protein [Variovorax sp. J22P168]MDM0014990.1 hypothetical protein [Variovorax sp. J22P168]
MTLFVSPYDNEALKTSRRAHEDRIRSGLPYVMPEAEARALLDQYVQVVMEARDALNERGIPRGEFPQMFNYFLRWVDAARQASLARQPARATAPAQATHDVGAPHSVT